MLSVLLAPGDAQVRIFPVADIQECIDEKEHMLD